jgi:hypothetical protein
MGLDIVHSDLAFGRYLLYTNVDIHLCCDVHLVRVMKYIT